MEKQLVDPCLGLPDVPETYPLHWAAAKGRLDLVKIIMFTDSFLCLLKDNKGKTPFHLAAINGHEEVMNELLLHEPSLTRDVTSDGETSLQLCVIHDQVEAARFLMDKDMELMRMTDGRGNTVLHLAASKKQAEMTELLLSDTNIEVNALNVDNYTALDVSLECLDNGNMEINLMLLRAGCVRNMSTGPLKLCCSTEKVKPCWKKGFNQWYKKDKAWLREMHNTLMVVAALIAAATFQAGISPPQSSIKTPNINSEIQLAPTPSEIRLAPTPSGFLTDTEALALMSLVRLFGLMAYEFDTFICFDVVGFVASLTVILSLVSGLPLQRRLTTWLLMITMWVAVISMALAFVSGVSITVLGSDVLPEISTVTFLGFLLLILLSHFVILLYHFLSWLSKIGFKIFKRILKAWVQYPKKL